MSMSTANRMKIVCGTMSFGKEGTRGFPHINSVEEANKVLDVFQRHGHTELDSARAYGEGTTEELLGDVSWQKRGLKMDTKLYPTAGHTLEKTAGYTHKPEDVRRGLLDSLKALKADKIEMFYLHGPDRKHPYEDTLRAVNELHEEGYFSRFGVSNFMAWEVAQMCEIAKRNGWIQPTAYEGHYHALQRNVEAELFPCLRYYGMSFYVYSPLASGFLTGRVERGQEITNLHLKYNWNPQYHDALDIIKPAAQKHGLTISETALRWLVHHSKLQTELSDAIILGAGSVKNLEANLTDLEKGPLPEDVVKALDDAWFVCKAGARPYHM
ncbi:aldo/keto reductase [Xylariaceae sp. FL1272]|nr:aldo/keto reductase [Xylariaceae sp. FL1272]